MGTKGRKNVKKPKMIKEQKEARELESSVAYKSLSLSLGLFATALLTYSILKDSWWVPLFTLGAIVFISGFYLVFFNKWKRHEALNQADRVPIRHIMLFLGLVSLGIGLIKSELTWLPVINAPLLGMVCIIVGYFGLIYGSIMAFVRLKNKKGGHLMGTKGRKNVKKPKQNKEKKGKKK